jgi:hypothetical protein
MRDPESLLRPGFWETLGSAIAVQIAWWHTVTALRDLTWYREGNESFLVMRIVWAIPVAALIGLVAWRGAAFGPRRGTFAWPGLAIGLGLVLGARLDAVNTLPIGPHTVLSAAALAGTATLVTIWAGHCATLVRTRWHGWFLGLSIAVVGYTLLGWFGEVRLADVVWRNNMVPVMDLLHGYAQTVLNEIGLKAVAIPFLMNFNRVLTVVALALLWLVPLVLRREFPRSAALAGALGCVPAVAAVVLLESAGTPLVATAWQVLAVVAVQLVVVLVARVDRVGALLTTWLIGLAATAAIWLTHLNGSQVDSILATRPHQVLPVLGTLAALLVGGRGRADGYVRSRPVWAAAIAVLGVAVASWWPSAGSSAQTLQPPLPASAEVDTDEAVAIWVYGGGQDRVTTVIQANDKVFAGVRAADPAAIAAGCEALGPVVREEFPEPPDAKIAATWAEALRARVSGARSGLVVFRDRGPDDGTMSKEFLKGIEQLKVTQAALVEAQERAIS